MSVISSHIISNCSNLSQIVPQDQRTRAQTVSMFSVNIVYSRAFVQQVQNPTVAPMDCNYFQNGLFYISCTGVFINLLNLDLNSSEILIWVFAVSHNTQ